MSYSVRGFIRFITFREGDTLSLILAAVGWFFTVLIVTRMFS